jgi:hypothetical protein
LQRKENAVPQINGVVVGIVVDTRDPLSQGRIRIRLPSIDQEIYEWARLAIGSGRGHAPAPQVDDEVLVAFEHGDMRRPFVIGALWNDTPTPPATRVLRVNLPTGSSLHAITQSDDACAAAASLLQQTAPWLASMNCVLGILRLLKPLIDVIHGLPSPSPRALQEFERAAADLAPCLLVTGAASELPFVRDLLCLAVQSLRCVLHNSQVASTEAVVPIQAILDSAIPFFTAAAVQPVQLAAVTNIQALPDDIARLQLIADALGGCADF